METFSALLALCVGNSPDMFGDKKEAKHHDIVTRLLSKYIIEYAAEVCDLLLLCRSRVNI